LFLTAAKLSGFENGATAAAKNLATQISAR
jgi:hypothetical protein